MLSRRSTPVRPAAGFWILILGLLAAMGCNNNGGDHNPSGTSLIQITDIPFSDLNSLTFTITEVSLFYSEKDAVKVFPPESNPEASITFDLVALGSGKLPISLSSVGSKEYTGIQLTYSNAQASAGSPSIPKLVSPSEGTFRVNFSQSEKISSESLFGILLDIDGNSSVLPAGSDVTFIPTVFALQGEGRLDVSELKGKVATVSQDRFVMDVLPSDDVKLGRIKVSLGVNSQMRIDGIPYNGPSGLSSLEEEDLVEVTGRMEQSSIAATIVQVDRPKSKDIARLRGTVLASSPFQIVVEKIDQQGGAEFDVRAKVTVTADLGTAFLNRAASGTISLSDFYPGQEVEVVGVPSGSSIAAKSLELLESVLWGSLTEIDLTENRGVISVDRLNPLGLDAKEILAVTEVVLKLSGASSTLEGTVSFPLTGFAAGQSVETRGYFAGAPNNLDPPIFVVSMISMVDLTDYSGAVGITDADAGTFTATVSGIPVTVHLSETSLLLVRHTGVPDQVFNRTRTDFLADLSGAVGPIAIRGFLSSSELYAVQASAEVPPPPEDTKGGKEEK